MPERPEHIGAADQRGSGTAANARRDVANAGSGRRIASGYEAIAAIESGHGDLLYLTPDIPRPTQESPGEADIRTAESASDLFPGLYGAALTGLRVAGITNDDDLSGVESTLGEAVRQHTPVVLHLGCSASHDGYTSLGRTGALQFFAANVQEAADLACIARRAVESALVPAVCGLDTDRTAEALRTISLPDADVLAPWLGNAADEVESPTPAQSMVFGDRRRRVPRSFDLDRPLGLGALRDADIDLQADAARTAFFTDHLSGTVDEAMRAFGELTGRWYGRVSPYRVDDADIVVLAQGALTRDLRAVVDHLRSAKGIRAGFLALNLLRPFPADLLASMLQDVSAVTILEKSIGTPIELRPLYRDVRVMMDVADIGDVFSGTCSGGRAAPSFDDLCAVYLNMTAGDTARHDFVIGARFEIDEPRLPALERMQRQIRRAWPALKNRVLDSTGTSRGRAGETRSVRLQATPEWDTRSAARLVAASLFDALGGDVEVQPGPDGRPGEPDIVDIRYSASPDRYGLCSTEIHVLLAAHPRLLASDEPLSALASGAEVCIVTDLDAASLWHSLPSHVRQMLRERDVVLRVVDAAGIAREIAPDPRFETLLTVMTAVGVLTDAVGASPVGAKGVGPATDQASAAVASVPDQGDAIMRAFLIRVDTDISGPDSLHEAIGNAVERGLSSVRTVNVNDLEIPASPDPEPAAPWPLRQAAKTADEATDPARFWKSVGYPFESGAPGHVLADPFLASGAMPARSSAGHKPGAVRSAAPVFLPERCTACGLCWSLCPDAAVAATVQEPKDLLTAAVNRAEADGHAVYPLRRTLKHVADAAERLAADDELDRFTRLGPLLREAWNRVAPRLGLSEQKRGELDDAFARVLEQVETFPIARAEPFHGEGLLLSIAVDVDACTSCGLCVRSCPEDALEMREHDEDGLDRYRVHLRMLRSLPEVPLETLDSFAVGADPPKPVYRLLNRRVHETMLGGESGGPGDSTRTALHLTLASAEATMQPRVDAFAVELRDLRDGLDDRIRDLLTEAVEVNDLEALARHLAAPADEHDEGDPAGERDRNPSTGREAGNISMGETDLIGLRAVEVLLRDDGGPHMVDRGRLQLLVRTRTEVDALLEAYEHAAHGDGRARMAAAFGTSDSSGARSAFPWNPYPFPWVFHLPERAPSIAEGLFEGVRSRMLDVFRTARTARLLVDRTYDSGEHAGLLRNLSWQDLTRDEIRLCPPVMVVVDRTGPAVDRLLRSRLPINVLHVDTGRYGRDGRELGVRAPDEPALRAIVAGTALVVQTSASMPDHLLSSAERGFNFDGPAFMNIHAGDPVTHGIRPEEAVEDARKAVLSRTVPLFTYDPGRGAEISERLDLGGNPAPNEDRATVSATVLSSTGRLVEATWPLTFADWAAGQDRFLGHFSFAPRPDWHDDMIPVATYMDLPDEKREHLQPYVQIPTPEGRVSRWIPSRDVLLETQRRSRIWNVLRELAGVKSGLADRIRAETDTRAESRIAEERARLQASYESRLSAELEQRERTHASRYHRRLREELLQLSGFAGEEALAGTVLRDYLETERDDRPASSDIPRDSDTPASSDIPKQTDA